MGSEMCIRDRSRTRSWKLGTHLVVTGSVVRRFYHAGGAVAARTEVNVASADVLSRKATARRIVAAMAGDVETTLAALS